MTEHLAHTDMTVLARTKGTASAGSRSCPQSAQTSRSSPSLTKGSSTNVIVPAGPTGRRRRTELWQNGMVTESPAGTVSVTLDEDGGIGMSVSPTDRPVDLLRAAAAVLERYAANLEHEQAPVICGVCGDQPAGVQALPSGQWQFKPCGHGVPMPNAASP